MKTIGLPEEIVSHLETFNNPKILEKELNAFRSLSSRYSQDVILEVMAFVKDGGIPPYGKLCLYPLTEMNESAELMSFFGDKKQPSLPQRKNDSAQPLDV